MAQIRLVVVDPSGLHARPAARFVFTASRFASRIVVREDGREADAKSLIALLGLSIRPSTEMHAVEVRAPAHYPDRFEEEGGHRQGADRVDSDFRGLCGSRRRKRRGRPAARAEG